MAEADDLLHLPVFGDKQHGAGHRLQTTVVIAVGEAVGGVREQGALTHDAGKLLVEPFRECLSVQGSVVLEDLDHPAHATDMAYQVGYRIAFLLG